MTSSQLQQLDMVAGLSARNRIIQTFLMSAGGFWVFIFGSLLFGFDFVFMGSFVPVLMAGQLAVVVGVGILALYVFVHLAQNKRLSAGSKVLWLLAWALLGPMPGILYVLCLLYTSPSPRD